MGRNLDEAKFAGAFDLQKTHNCALIRISRVSRRTRGFKVRSRSRFQPRVECGMRVSDGRLFAVRRYQHMIYFVAQRSALELWLDRC